LVCVLFSIVIKNIGSFQGSEQVQLRVDNVTRYNQLVKLLPGEEKLLSFKNTFSKPGLFQITLADLPPQKLRVHKTNTETVVLSKNSTIPKPLLYFNFNQDSGNVVQDQSTYSHNGIVKGNVRWVNGLLGQAIQTNAPHGSYIEIPNSPDLQKIAQETTLTMMAWIYPMDEKNFADIFTKGDWNVIQLRASNTAINFYSGGYARGEAYSSAPTNWNRHWHHLAGVTEGKFQKLYVDGELVVTKEIETDAKNQKNWPIGDTSAPWNIGRNAQNPERIFKGYIDEVMLFQKALSKAEIWQIMLKPNY